MGPKGWQAMERSTDNYFLARGGVFKCALVYGMKQPLAPVPHGSYLRQLLTLQALALCIVYCDARCTQKHQQMRRFHGLQPMPTGC